MKSFCLFLVLGVVGLSLGRVADRSADTESIFFRWHKSKNLTSNDININHVADLYPHLNVNVETVFHIHGYGENVDSESVKVIVEAYLKHTKKNIIAIDYRQISNNINYIADVTRVNAIGSALANAFNILVEKGLNPKKIHIIGHSLGSQIAANIATHLKFRITRITGLDPAGPGFYIESHLKSGDAKFVDIIHTDKLFYGSAYNSGDVDFLPNYGHRLQPGCLPDIPLTPGDYCSHHRVCWLYAESVKNPKGFLGVECAGDLEFSLGLCNQTNVIPMGAGTPTTAKGTYYLTTNPSSPFAKGLEGTKP
ncbi:pancreatic lipase-related protein 2-like [Augochlora pura]